MYIEFFLISSLCLLFAYSQIELLPEFIIHKNYNLTQFEFEIPLNCSITCRDLCAEYPSKCFMFGFSKNQKLCRISNSTDIQLLQPSSENEWITGVYIRSMLLLNFNI